MFGLKTKIINSAKSSILKFTRNNLSNEIAVKELMLHFHADSFGHRANYEKGDMGYGFFHYGLVRTVKPKRILCIGSRHGYIPAVYAQACKDNKKGFVDFVDAGYGISDKNHWTGVGYWKTTEGKNTFKNFKLQDYIKLYLTTTQSFHDKTNFEYDIVYVDGDHSFEGARLDHKLFWPRIKKGGFMIFHDVSVKEKKQEGEYGVYKLWKDISKANAISLDYIHSGLGIVQKK